MAGTAEQTYLAYLLRLWQISDKGDLVWRASLERAHTDERLGFDSVEALCRYLQDRTGGQSSSETSTKRSIETKTDVLKGEQS